MFSCQMPTKARVISERTVNHQISFFMGAVVGRLQPVPRDPNDKGQVAMLDDVRKCHPIGLR